MGSRAERNKAIVRRLYGEVMARGNVEVADEIFADDFVEHHGNVSLFEVHEMLGSHDIDGTLA